MKSYIFGPFTNSYNRQKAVEYALTYALSPNPQYQYISVDCSNFISQCLRAGSAPMVYGTSRPWWYNNMGTANTDDDRWSVSWAVAHSLYWCLKVRGKTNFWGLRGIEVSNLAELELGDIIQYEGEDGVIYHSAIVTDFTTENGSKVPLITQHTYDAANISYYKPAAKKMHFMKIVVAV
ncbi:amidase domain-containing protein [Bacillota bacterium LX-D]|nr:amidase domain-containing protein [Bacillota bacterium LX-D]